MEEWYGQQGCRLELLVQLLRIKTQQEAGELTGQTENNQKSEFIHHSEAGDEASDVSNKVKVTKTVVNYKDIIKRVWYKYPNNVYHWEVYFHVKNQVIVKYCIFHCHFESYYLGGKKYVNVY